MLILDHDLLHTITNHPVHIIDSKGNLSPSSFIPFCAFGENMEIIGTRIGRFNDPVCNSFVPTLHHNQLCYKIDLEKFRNNNEIEDQLKYGLDMILDYNENRQFVKDNKQEKIDESKRKPIFHSEKQESVSIHLDTISNKYFFLSNYL